MTDNGHPTTDLVEAPPEPLLRVVYPHTETDETYHVAPTLQLGFVPTERLVEMLRDRGFKHPYLLVTIRRERKRQGVQNSTYNEWQEISRRLEPLDGRMTYLTFQNAGTHQLAATIVDVPDNGVLRVVQAWVDEPQQHALYESGSDDIQPFRFEESYPRVRYIDAEFRQLVDVDDGHFAKEPPEWQRKFVARFFKGRPYDQCDNRERLIFSGLAALFSLAIWPVRAAIVLFLLALGVRNLNWKVLDPIEWRDGNPLSPYDGKDHHSFWWYRKATEEESKYDDYVLRHWIFVALNPVVLVYAPLLVWWVTGWFDLGWSFWFCLALCLGVMLGTGIGIGICIGVGALWNMFRDWITKKSRELDNEADELKARQQRDLYAKLAQLAQSGPVSEFDQLPKEARTLRLRFFDLKQKVCKVYQKS